MAGRARRLAVVSGLAALLAATPLLAPEFQNPPTIPEDDGQPHELLVRFIGSTGSGARTASHRAQGAYRAQRSRRGGWERVVLPPYAHRARARRDYANNPYVDHVEPNRRVRAAAATVTPDDPRYDEKWGLRRINMPEAWGAMDTPGDAGGVVVAVLDSGIDRNHPDLTGNIWNNPDPTDCATVEEGEPCDDQWGWDFVNGDNEPDDDAGHGTHVAGIIGAVGNNDQGVAGVAWDVQLMAIRFLGSDGSGSTADAIKGIDYAVANGADIINGSYVVGGTVPTPLASGCADLSDGRFHCEAIERAREAGVHVVAAAGNDGADNDSGGTAEPAFFPLENLISVASTEAQDDDGLAGFSNFGRRTVHLAAPGNTILSTVLDDGYGDESGTSMAAPLVTGVLALLLSERPDIDARRARERILGTVDRGGDLAGEAGDELAETLITGGRLEAHRALTASDDTIPLAAPSHFGATVDDNGVIHLSWLPNSTPERTSGYRIQRRRADETAYTTVHEGADREQGEWSESDELEFNTYYDYRVRAVGDATTPDSRWSAIVSVKDTGELPVVPSGLKARADERSVRLSWDEVPGAEWVTLEVRRWDEQGRRETVFEGDGDALSFRDVVPELGEYEYRIRSCLEDVCSAWSAAVTTRVVGDGTASMAQAFEGFEESERDPRCFIATAAYGSPWEDEVEALRAFRDERLMPYPAGRWLVEAYYRVSPPFARWIAADDERRAAARRLLEALFQRNR